MMKSPTSLIRIRYAVGAMLALSAIFAVVISSVTLTHERPIAEAQSTPPPPVEVSLSTDNDQRSYNEGTNVSVKVSLPMGKTAPSGGLVIPIKVTEGTANKGTDFTLRPEGATEDVTTATILSGTRTIRYTIVNIDTRGLEPQETFTVSLDTQSSKWPSSSYIASATAGSITFMINDKDNRDPTGTVSIDVNDDKGMAVDDDAEGFVPKVGHVLTANISGVTDLDQPLTADTTDGESERDPPTFKYQWIRTNDGSTSTDDPDVAISGETSSTYPLTNEDVGDTFTVQVWSSDNFGNGDGNANEDPATSPQGVNSNGFTLDTPSPTQAIAYNMAKPFIIVGALEPAADGDNRIEPKVVLTRDTSGMFNASGNLIDDKGKEIKVDLDGDGSGGVTSVSGDDVTYAWYNGTSPIMTCGDGNSSLCDGLTYTLANADVADKITVVATYTTQTTPTPAKKDISSLNIGRVYSPTLATGKPEISGDAQLAATLTASKGTIADADGIDATAVFTYEWFHGDADVKTATPLHTGSTYPVGPNDANKTLKVRATFKDSLGDTEMRTSAPTLTILGSPGMVSKVEPAIRSATVSAGDVVTLSVNMYGLQNAMDNGLGGTFSWMQEGGGSLTGSGRELSYTAPSSPGTYTVKATLSINDCAPKDENMRDTACTAEFVVKVRRPSAAPDPDPAPVNPPGDIPGILADASGNQYEVFTPEGGGTFTGEGYTLSAAAGAVPNGEFIGIRMSDEGAASNAGMTHQRYTLGGNMYAVSAVDAGGTSINSYVLDDPATVCVPLPDELRTDISELALLTINSDGSLTVLSAQVRISDAGTMVCGNLSGLPASVAVGSAGAPAAIPTATPEPTPEPPDTGGTAPSSSTLPLWSLLLGIAVLGLGSALVIGRRREWGAKG